MDNGLLFVIKYVYHPIRREIFGLETFILEDERGLEVLREMYPSPFIINRDDEGNPNLTSPVEIVQLSREEFFSRYCNHEGLTRVITIVNPPEKRCIEKPKLKNHDSKDTQRNYRSRGDNYSSYSNRQRVRTL